MLCTVCHKVPPWNSSKKGSWKIQSPALCILRRERQVKACHAVQGSQIERDVFIHSGTHILWLTYKMKDSPACEVSPLHFLILQKPPKPKLLYTLEELPVIILTIYYSTSPLTQFWFDGGLPDSPELSKNLDTITLALGSSTSSTSSALCSANITLWCVYVCQILIPTFAARKTFHPPSLLLWLSHIFL